MERISFNNLNKVSISLFVGLFFSFLFNQSLILAVAFFLIILAVFILSKFSDFYFSNIFLLLIFLCIFSDDSFIQSMMNEINIYNLFYIWKFNIFEWWILGLFFVFTIYRIFSAIKNRAILFSLGPLKPLLLFSIVGLVMGALGTIKNKGDFSLNQIRYYFEGLLLYILMLNINFKKVRVKPYMYFIICLVSVKALFHFVLYILGHGLNFGIIGNIVMGYGDILQNIVLTSLIVFSAMIFIKNMAQWEYSFGWVVLLLNSIVIFLSLRRVSIGLYVLGLFVITLFSNIKIKIRSILFIAMSAIFIIAILFITGEHERFWRICQRVSSVNIFKYQDDSGLSITSSSGHISEFMSGWSNIKGNFIFGKGFGVEIEKRGWSFEHMMVHNELFFYWIRMGIFGMLMFFSMYLIPIYYCFKHVRANNRHKWFYLAALGFITGKFLIGLTVAPPISIAITKSFIYFLLLGLLMNQTFFKEIR